MLIATAELRKQSQKGTFSKTQNENSLCRSMGEILKNILVDIFLFNKVFNGKIGTIQLLKYYLDIWESIAWRQLSNPPSLIYEVCSHVSSREPPWCWNDWSSPLYQKGSGVLEKVRAILWLSRAEARLRAFYCGDYLVPVCAAGTVDSKSIESWPHPTCLPLGQGVQGILVHAVLRGSHCSAGGCRCHRRPPHEHCPPPGDSQGSNGEERALATWLQNRTLMNVIDSTPLQEKVFLS